MPGPPTLARSDVREMVLAEFDGKVYAAVRQMTFSTKRDDDECFDSWVAPSCQFTLACECRASAEWARAAAEDGVTAFQYRHRSPGDLDVHVAIVRTPIEAPICEHWIELALKVAT